MELFRVNAYSVSPQRGTTSPSEPEGGAVEITINLRQVINDNLQSADLDRRTTVDFQVDPTTRTNPTRDAITAYAFGSRSSAQTAAIGLARRLSAAMDLRSDPCLLVLAARRKDDDRAITLWTFPRDEAFRLRRGRSGPSIEVLTDIFSQTMSFELVTK